MKSLLAAYGKKSMPSGHWCS